MELGGQLHLGHRLAIAFRMGAAEVAGVPLLERFAFLVAHDHDLVAVELGEAGADGPIVAEELVAVQLDELVEHQVQIVGGHGPVGMPGDLDRLPRLQLAVDLLLQIGQLAAKPADLVANIRRLRDGCLQFRQASLQLIDRSLQTRADGYSQPFGDLSVSTANQ